MSNSIEEILKKDLVFQDHFKAKELAEFWDIPEIDYEASFGNDHGIAKELIQVLISYLHMPYLIDDFETDHRSRRVWRENLRNKYGDGADRYLKNNALRLNAASPQIPRLLSEFYKPEKPSMESALSQITETAPGKDYNLLETSRKLGVVKNYKQKVYEFIQILADS